MKAKPIILIVVTLVIGFFLGMLASAKIRYQKLQPMRVFFSEQRFRDGFYNIIQPDEKQKAEIDELLSKYGKLNGQVMNDFRKRNDSIMKEFWKDLEPSLTKDQLSRLKEMEKKRMEMFRQRRNTHDSTDFRDRRRMPPPGGRQPYRGGMGERDSAPHRSM